MSLQPLLRVGGRRVLLLGLLQLLADPLRLKCQRARFDGERESVVVAVDDAAADRFFDVGDLELSGGLGPQVGGICHLQDEQLGRRHHHQREMTALPARCRKTNDAPRVPTSTDLAGAPLPRRATGRHCFCPRRGRGFLASLAFRIRFGSRTSLARRSFVASGTASAADVLGFLRLARTARRPRRLRRAWPPGVAAAHRRRTRRRHGGSGAELFAVSRHRRRRGRRLRPSEHRGPRDAGTGGRGAGEPTPVAAERDSVQRRRDLGGPGRAIRPPEPAPRRAPERAPGPPAGQPRRRHRTGTCPGPPWAPGQPGRGWAGAGRPASTRRPERAAAPRAGPGGRQADHRGPAPPEPGPPGEAPAVRGRWRTFFGKLGVQRRRRNAVSRLGRAHDHPVTGRVLDQVGGIPRRDHALFAGRLRQRRRGLCLAHVAFERLLLLLQHPGPLAGVAQLVRTLGGVSG